MYEFCEFTSRHVCDQQGEWQSEPCKWRLWRLGEWTSHVSFQFQIKPSKQKRKANLLRTNKYGNRCLVAYENTLATYLKWHSLLIGIHTLPCKNPIVFLKLNEALKKHHIASAWTCVGCGRCMSACMHALVINDLGSIRTAYPFPFCWIWHRKANPRYLLVT